MTEDTIRVQVISGDGTKYLGEGTYVGDVSVHFFRMADGSLRSLKDAETMPDQEIINQFEKVGGQLVTTPYNPKIVLDSGKIVYGCQVWWKRIEGGEDG